MNQRHQIGRNDLCPCRSGKKYKRCCLNSESPFPSPFMFTAADANLRRLIENNRTQKFGHVRPLVHADWQDGKLIAVGSELHHSGEWKTPIDFLQYYMKYVLTPAWGNAETKKPFAERHPVMQWYDSLCKLQAKQTPGTDGVYGMVLNGAARCYLLLAFDLFTLRHHQALERRLVHRLQHKDQFQGARHEAFVAATCIRAGYTIDYEDETDGTSKHVEFTATHRATGQKISVEAKSRHRPGVLGRQGKSVDSKLVDAGIQRLIADALNKPASEPLVIFLDLNLPPYSPAHTTKEWFEKIADPILAKHAIGKTSDPWNLLLFSNIPNHYVDDDEPAPRAYINGLFGKNPAVPTTHPEALTALFDAALKFGNLPNSFEEMR